MKRIFLISLLTLCTLTMLADSSTSGHCGADMKWKFSEKKGELTIRGGGIMNNYSEAARAPWYHLREQIRSVEIGRSVTSIGNYAFDGCSSLQTIEIDPDRSELYSIGDAAFQDCKQLGAIVLPPRVQHMGTAALRRTGLTSFTMPAHMTELSPSLLEGCAQLSDVRFSSIKTIGNNAFAGCARITSIALPNTVQTIGNNAFASCSSLAQIQLPQSLTSVGEAAFSNDGSLVQISIPAGTAHLGRRTFDECANLRQVTFEQGSSITTLPEKFCNNARSLDSIVLPSGLTHIGPEALANTFALKHASLPRTIQSIGKQAFEGSGLISIILPASLRHLSDRCFYKCQNLKSVSIDQFAGIDTIPYEMCALATELETVQLGDRIHTIGQGAFSECFSLKSINMPPSLRTIGSQAFQQTSLRTVTLPRTISTIGEQAFSRCKKLKTLTIEAGAALREIPAELCAHDENLRSAQLPNSVTSIGNRAFYQTYKMASVNMPESVRTIGRQAFQQSGIRSLTIGPQLATIASDAFEQCTKIDTLTWNSATLRPSQRDLPTYSLRHQIRDLTFGIRVSRITRDMCAQFDSLQSISLQNMTAMIGVGAFNGNPTLHSITYPKNAPAINPDIVHLYIAQQTYATQQTDTTTTLLMWPTGALAYFELHGPVKAVRRVSSPMEPRFVRDNAEATFDEHAHLTSCRGKDVVDNKLALDTITLLIAYDTLNTLTGMHGNRNYTETMQYDDRQRMVALSAADNFTDITRSEYRYDNTGRMLSATTRLRYEVDGRIAFRTESSVYQVLSADEHGNWTARKDDQGNIMTREIEYYQP